MKTWSAPIPSDWERDSAGILVKIQWFGLLVGFLLANVPGREPDSPLLLNVLLLVGLATRLSATALLVMTLVIQIFVYPGAYATHGVWAAALLTLMAYGPGRFSLDHAFARRG